MDFSLSRRASSRALGRNWNLFNFLVLVVLFNFFRRALCRGALYCSVPFRAVLVHQKSGEPVERNNFVRISLENRRPRHSAHDAGIFALRDSHSAGRLNRAETFRAVIAHAGHQKPDGGKPKFLRHGMEQNIGRRTMSIHRRAIGKYGHVSARHVPNHHVAISRADEHAARNQKISRARFVNFEGAALIEALRKHFRESFGHVLHDHDGGLKIRGNLRQDILERVGTAGGNSDGNDAARRKRRANSFFLNRLIVDDSGREPASGRALGHFYFCDQLIGDFFEAARGGVFRFGNKIDSAEREGFERGVPAFFRMRAEQDHGERRATHDQAQRFHSVHARHFQIERHDIRLELLNFFQSKCAVHRGANDFDRGIARENRGDQFPHQRGIVHDQDSNTFCHAMAPSGFARERRDRTAGTFKMRTTVPSPRMDAPLTKSLEIISAGSALMTNSSSPTRLSTSRPKRFSAAPMTMTKCFFLTGCVSMLRKRLSSSKRTSVRIWSRSRRTSRWSTRWISWSAMREISTTEESGTANKRPPTRKSSV